MTTPRDPILLLPDLLFEVRGAKAANFLHGQLTAHIKDLAEQTAAYSFFLNTKGKIQTDLYVYRLPDRYLLAVPPAGAEVLITHLQKLAPLSQVTLTALPEASLLHFINAVPPTELTQCQIANARYFQKGYDAVISSRHISDFSVLSEIQAETWRIRQGVPQFGVDFTSENLPQETGRYDALHFDKGCYLGQEIVTRLEHRGHVNKLLVRIECANRITVGDGLVDVQKNEVGRVSSTFFDEQSNRSYAISVLAWKTWEEQKPVFYDGTPVSYFSIGLDSVSKKERL